MIITCKCGKKFASDSRIECSKCNPREGDIVDVAIDAGIAAIGASLLSNLSHSDDSSSSSSSSDISGGGGDFGGGGASGDY